MRGAFGVLLDEATSAQGRFFDYPPQTVLKEALLAQEFGVSRTPIRQILQMLESERLVEIRDGVGTIVTGIDFRRLRDVYDLRLRITALLGDFIDMQRAKEAAIEIEDLIARAEQLENISELRAFWVVESDRHRLINSLIDNEPLREIHDSLYMQTSRCGTRSSRTSGLKPSRRSPPSSPSSGAR